MIDKLREARIARAKDLAAGPTKGQRHLLFAHILIDLIEQDWRPEPEVDAVEAAFKAWDQDAPSDAGFLDAFRAGHAHARQALEATDD